VLTNVIQGGYVNDWRESAMFAFKMRRDSIDGAPKKPVLLARPVKGDVDHKAILQDILKRFPKTIAYLAK
jgi:hypothetical protein